jgi:hypothetical protein
VQPIRNSMYNKYETRDKAKQYTYKVQSNNVSSIWQLCLHLVILFLPYQWCMGEIYCELQESEYSGLASHEGFSFLQTVTFFIQS